MNYRETDHLRVLIANEREDRLALVAPIVVALGHQVIARRRGRGCGDGQGEARRCPRRTR